jgi:hypothetical protein
MNEKNSQLEDISVFEDLVLCEVTLELRVGDCCVGPSPELHIQQYPDF